MLFTLGIKIQRILEFQTLTIFKKILQPRSNYFFNPQQGAKADDFYKKQSNLGTQTALRATANTLSGTQPS